MRRTVESADVRPSPVAYVADPAALAQTLFDLIDAATHSVLLQMYLLAGNHELCLLRPREGIFPWADLLADKLIAKRRRSPEVTMAVILDTQTPDDASLTRKGHGPLVRHRLESAGIPVLNANLFGTTFNAKRRFPPAARFHARPHEETPQAHWVAAQQRWQTWHNVEDHRKNLVIDAGRWGAITSHNAIDIASDWHDNLLLIGGPAARELWVECTGAVRDALQLPQRLEPAQREGLERWSTEAPPKAAEAEPSALPRGPIDESLRALGNPRARPEPRPGKAQVISSKDIRRRLEEAIDSTPAGAAIRVASTYFSDLPVLHKLLAAGARGVDVQVLIDDCHGLPLPAFESWFVRSFVNLRVLLEAVRRPHPGLELRVHRSGHGPMMHLKTAAFLGPTRFLIGGQANYTPNTFSGAWLDTALYVEEPEAVEGFLAQYVPLWEAAQAHRPLSAAERPKALSHLSLLSIAERLGFRP